MTANQRKFFENKVKPGAEAHKRKQEDKAVQGNEPEHGSSRPPAKRTKFASGANAVKLG